MEQRVVEDLTDKEIQDINKLVQGLVTEVHLLEDEAIELSWKTLHRSKVP